MYNDIGNVMVACRQVQKQCAPALKTLDPVPLNFSKARFQNSLSKILSPARPDCSITKGVVYYGNDFGDGFTTLTLSPEECCLLCLQKRTCKAWSRLGSGQCWTKWNLSSEEDWRSEEGSTSGIRSGTKSVFSFCDTILETLPISAKSGPEAMDLLMEKWPGNNDPAPMDMPKKNCTEQCEGDTGVLQC